MTPGPTIIYQCYKCEGNFKYPTIGSGNTFGARFWSDGKKDAPMLPDQPWLIKCPNCDALIWRDELKQIGEAEAGPSAYNIPLPILLNLLEIRPTPMRILTIMNPHSYHREHLLYSRIGLGVFLR